jgi:hypothetical protein
MNSETYKVGQKAEVVEGLDYPANIPAGTIVEIVEVFARDVRIRFGDKSILAPYSVIQPID